MNQLLKKLSAVFLFAALSFAVVNAQDSNMGKQKLKKHHCTAACKMVNGKHVHVYAHGEKGHVCTDECKKMEKASSTKM